MSWLYVFLGFSALIVLHEAGHFVAAKATGMRVERFFLFFPPKLVSVKLGETEYGIGAIPLGGYVKISGMNRVDSTRPAPGGPAASEEDVGQVDERGSPVPSPEEDPRGYYRQPVWKRLVVIGAGPAVNIALAFVVFFLVFAVDAQKGTQTVGGTLPGSPAATTLKPGDRILAVDGRTYPNLDPEARLRHFVDQVESHKCAGKPTDGCRAALPVALRLKRDGQVRTIPVRPEYDAAEGATRIGFSFREVPAELSVGTAAKRAVDAMWAITRETGKVVGNIFKAQERKQLSGIVGISDVAHQTIGLGVGRALMLLGLVSLSLGLINLLPFLPLDGGHIFWSLVEKVRGRPASLLVMERVSIVGFVLVVMLMFIGLSNDIGRLSGEGFHVR
jgi:regulator of sigma E protease